MDKQIFNTRLYNFMPYINSYFDREHETMDNFCHCLTQKI
jgi:hypothetical protein